jgi:transposase-like protein
VIDADAIRMRYEAVAGHLDERGLRLFAASEARAAGRGGIALVSQLTGIARSTIGRGLKDLDREATEWPHGLIRRSGGGRKAASIGQPGLRKALLHLVASATRGDPQADLLWVSRSHRHLSAALAEQGFHASRSLVGRLLEDLGFSLQANAKIREGRQHPDRDEQFQHINDAIERFRRGRQPAISVDTKKKGTRPVGAALRPVVARERSVPSNERVRAHMTTASVLTGHKHRRRWSSSEKARIVEESFAPGAIVVEVARRYDVYANQLHRWRREARAASSVAQPRLLPVTVTPGCGATGPGTIEIELDGVRVRVDGSVDEAALGRVLRVLGR